MECKYPSLPLTSAVYSYIAFGGWALIWDNNAQKLWSAIISSCPNCTYTASVNQLYCGKVEANFSLIELVAPINHMQCFSFEITLVLDFRSGSRIPECIIITLVTRFLETVHYCIFLYLNIVLPFQLPRTVSTDDIKLTYLKHSWSIFVIDFKNFSWLHPG